MDFTVWKDVCISSLYAVFVSVFILWLCRRFGAKQNVERVVEPAQDGDTTRDESTLEPKHKVFLSHSGAQKDFVEQLCKDLERCDRYPFFDRRWSSLPIGREFPKLIFEAIEQCEVGVVVLSEEFFTLSKWPMLELVAMTKNVDLVIIPVFLGMSLKQYRDPKRQERWISKWRGWAQQEKGRGRQIDIKEWCGALRALGPINSLEFDGGSKVSFRERIVNAVCDLVLSEARWEDSHVLGRSRLSEVVCKKIDEAKVSQKYGVPVVGLHGVGGIGKTTVCQTLCNEYSRRMQGRVFHAELRGASDMELLQRALKRLTEKSHEFINGLDKSQCKDLLKREMQKQPIFLAIDNMSETIEFIEQAKYFLSGQFSKGSIVVVTARSLDVLQLGLLDIDDSNCHEMPELLKDEAKSLFMEHAKSCHKGRLEIHKEIIDGCLERCNFKKGDGKSYHYHPLALKVLGTQLGCSKYDRNKWATTLIELDTFNQLREEEHPIFSILRKSFDILRLEDQMLFMDVALFLPERQDLNMTWFDWLSMVHGSSVDGIKDRLEGLKKKSLLHDLGDGRSKEIGMHDLWHEFAVMESKAGKFEGRRWLYEVGSWSALEEGSPSGGLWQNMKRMCFLMKGLESAKSISFDHFSNITVMKMVADLYAQRSVNLRMDMQKLKHLKSMELSFVDAEAVGLGLMENLCFLSLSSATLSKAVVDDIGHLTNLRVLVWVDMGGEGLPNVSKLISLEEVYFYRCKYVTISGFSSRLSKLRILNLSGGWFLRRLEPGVGDLVALQEFRLCSCHNLEELPNLQKLTSLRTLDISFCKKVKSLPGLGELVGLRQLRADGCVGLAKLPDMRKLTNLQVLDLQCCPLESAPGMDVLIALQELVGNFRQLPQQPDILRYSLLRYLWLEGYNSQEVFVRSLVGLSVLVELKLLHCTLRDEMPDCQSLNLLKVVEIEYCDFKDVSGLSSCTALETLMITSCRWLERLPDLHKLSRLELLSLKECDILRDVHCIGSLSQLKSVRCRHLPLLTDLPDLNYFPQLEEFVLGSCTELVRLECTGPMVELYTLTLTNCRNLISIPDMSHFPSLRELHVYRCDSLMELTCTGALTSLEIITVTCCRHLRVIPDLSNFPELRILEIENCESLMELTCTAALTSLQTIKLRGCCGLRVILDLSNFPELRILKIENCESLMELTCTGALASLQTIKLEGCCGLMVISDLSNFLELRILEIENCESLMELTCTGALTSLQTIKLRGCCGLRVISDLSNFPELRILKIENCESLMELTCTGALASLQTIKLRGCCGLRVISDLSNFPELRILEIENCESLMELTCTAALTSLQTIKLRGCCGLRVISDLSNFPELRILEIENCESLMELTCTGALTSLQTIKLTCCHHLRVIPDLSNFPEMWILEIENCESLMELTCTRALASLESIKLKGCFGLRVISDLSNFPEMRILEIENCESLMELTCTGALASLQTINLTCCGLEAIPDLSNFPQLWSLRVSTCESLLGLTSTGNSSALVELVLGGCRSVHVIPDLCNFSRLKVLRLTGCESLAKLACSGPAAALGELHLGGCQRLNGIPDLFRFPHLKEMCLRVCDSLQDLTCSGPLPTLTDLSLFDCLRLKTVPDLGNFPGLSSLYLIGCESLTGMTCSAPSAALHTLYVSGCGSLRSVPNLRNYPYLAILHLICCESLGTLPCSVPLTALKELVLSACSGLDAVPDLCNFPQLTTLWLSGCKRLVELTCTEPVAALERFVLRGCDRLKEVPDLCSFPQLKVLEVTGSESLMELVCRGPLVSLEELNLGGCRSLRAVPNVSNFPRLQLEKFTPQEPLHDP